MTRPLKTAVPSGVEGWDSELNDSLDTLFDGPLPPHEWPSTGTKTLAELETQYPAASFDRCLVNLNETTRGWVMCWSNGTAWRVVSNEPAAVALTDAASIAVDAAALGPAGTGRVTLTANRALANPSGGFDGQVITIEVTQDATGGRTLTYGSKYRFSTDVPSPTLTTTGTKRDVLLFKYHATDDKWDCLAVNKGF